MAFVMKDWKLLAAALDLDIPEAEMERVKASLDAVEAAFGPLTSTIPLETEPAYVLLLPPEVEA